MVTAGVPIGSDAFVCQFARQRLSEHAVAHDELEHVRDVQAAYLLLRCSLSVRFHFLLRLQRTVAARELANAPELIAFTALPAAATPPAQCRPRPSRLPCRRCAEPHAA